jgi:predicted AAA+ superfamily ATPase
MDTTKSFYWLEAKLTFASLSVYRGILGDKVSKKMYKLIELVQSGDLTSDQFLETYSRFYYELLQTGTTCWKQYLIDRLILMETPFSQRVSLTNQLPVDNSLTQATANDLRKLQFLSDLSADKFKEYALDNLCSSALEKTIIEQLPEWEPSVVFPLQRENQALSSIKQVFKTADDWGNCIDPLTEFFRKNGSGAFAKYNAFVWDNTNGLTGISTPDPVRFSDLIGYEKERSLVIENTCLFLKGFPANNVLLYGDRGTGKSSTVKALLNEYHSLGLRLIELPKASLADLPQLIRLIKDSKLKFIVFVDDLAFEDNEENYTSLKAILEGGIESKPDNLVIYATSNRRHLIKEKFSERAGLQSINRDDQVRAADTIQEKLSLSDRFGITVVFSTPDQDKYLSIVQGIAQKRGLEIDRERLTNEALKWELWYNGRSPRTARQFVDWLEGKLKS